MDLSTMLANVLKNNFFWCTIAKALMLERFYYPDLIEAGCDEAGRGCLAGPVVAAAVVLPKDFSHPFLNDSKQLTEKQRDLLRPVIEQEALAWGVAMVNNLEIDEINILNASFLAMHKAIDQLKIAPQALLIDGNRFKKYKNLPHHCIIKGDGRYMSIAAASILAKTHRDEYMMKLHEEFPHYAWNTNKAYPTPEHRQGILAHGETPYHRKSFGLLGEDQMTLEL
jgi:ribonuclease HII